MSPLPKISELSASSTVTDDDLLVLVDDPGGTPASKKATALVVKGYASVVDQNTQTGSYTLVLADAGKAVEMNVGSANDLTVPPNASVAFPVGTVIEVCQLGAGTTTLVPGSGVTLSSRGSALELAGQYAVASLRKRATNEWVVTGDVTA